MSAAGPSARRPRGPRRRLGILGRGRLGRALALAVGEDGAAPVFELAWQTGREDPPEVPVEVVIDASAGDAVPGHLEWAIEQATPLVIAATGWRTEEVASQVGDRLSVLLAPNGSLTVALMTRLAHLLGAYGRQVPGAGGWLLDHHHAAKRDAPSGTALHLAEAFERGAGHKPSIAAVRAGHEVGRHVLGLDAPGETLELSHRARSRAPFAHGLLSAADWLTRRGEPGVFTMDDLAAERLDPLFQLSHSPLEAPRGRPESPENTREPQETPHDRP